MTDRSWSIVIFPVDFQRKGHIVDDVCDLSNVALFLIHFFKSAGITWNVGEEPPNSLPIDSEDYSSYFPCLTYKAHLH